jgi:predicted small secreted protein
MNEWKKDVLILLMFLVCLVGAMTLTGCMVGTLDGLAKDIRAGATYVDDHIEDR